MVGFARETYLPRLFPFYMLRQRYVGAAFVCPICSRVYNPGFDGLRDCSDQRNDCLQKDMDTFALSSIDPADMIIELSAVVFVVAVDTEHLLNVSVNNTSATQTEDNWKRGLFARLHATPENVTPCGLQCRDFTRNRYSRTHKQRYDSPTPHCKRTATSLCRSTSRAVFSPRREGKCHINRAAFPNRRVTTLGDVAKRRRSS